MKRVFIIHGWGGGPQKDWLPWLKTELEKSDYEVFVPDMPDTETPVIDKWVSHLARIVKKQDSQTYFVGHSIGCQTILRYLEASDAAVGDAIFVAGWFNLKNLEDGEVEEIARPWLTTPIDFEKVKKVLNKSILVISDNDPFGAFEENKKKFSEIGSEIVTLHNAGHITGEDGFTEIPVIVEQLQKVTSDPQA